MPGLMDDAEGGGSPDHSDEAISRFYDRHPYPPPVEDLDDVRDLWNDLDRRRADHHLLWPMQPFREDLDVLVAGCGTSQAARHALRRPAASVVGIDVSETSLRSTDELRRRYDLENLKTRRLPIERIAELDQTFDLMVCTGVLHHLADPDLGLSALRAVLRPGGAMQLMVYAPYGRAGVSMMQEYSRRLGIEPTESEVRDLAHTLAEVPLDHPLAPLLRDAPDFRSLGGLADALLNPRDRTYSVPQLFDYLDRNGLTFGRWNRQAPYLPQCGAVAETPHAQRLQSLPEPEQYAAVELFRGSMVRHSLVAHRAADGPGTGPFTFEGDRWMNSVPIRLPNTIQVEERLPAGAAAVLVNQSHTYQDLILAITESEKRLFARIDGRRTVAEVAADGGAGGSEGLLGVRGFFQRLWQYDQVVFDASAA